MLRALVVGLAHAALALTAPLPRRAILLRSIPTSLLLPSAAHAASNTYDFGYRLNRALDPDFRGPVSDVDAGGMSALDAMCNPVMPIEEEELQARSNSSTVSDRTPPSK